VEIKLRKERSDGGKADIGKTESRNADFPISAFATEIPSALNRGERCQSRRIGYFRFLRASGRRLARKWVPVKFNCFAGNFKARQRLEKRRTAAILCLYDFALNDFASVPAPLASEDAPLPLGKEWTRKGMAKSWRAKS
jgi:hypothetical protein